jgi:hypothetical protein
MDAARLLYGELEIDAGDSIDPFQNLMPCSTCLMPQLQQTTKQWQV